MHNFRSFANPRDEMNATLMLTKHTLGEQFEDIQEDVITKFLKSHREDLSIKNLREVMAKEEG